MKNIVAYYLPDNIRGGGITQKGGRTGLILRSPAMTSERRSEVV